MSHSYGNPNSTGNNYLNRKRAEDDIPNYYYDKYDKFDKYGTHSNSRYNNSMNYNYSKPPPKMNSYYSSNPRYYNNYYSRQKPFYSNMNYSNGLSQKRDYRKPYQKISAPGSTEGIRNLSHCDMPSSSPLPINRKNTDSLKLTDANSSEIKQSPNLNIKNINKYVPNMNQGHPIISQQNININIKLSSSSTNLKYNSKEDKKIWKKKEDLIDKERRYDLQLIPFPQPSPSLMNFRPFDKTLVKLEPNPLEKFVLYPNHLYELNMAAIYNPVKRTNNGTSIKELINRDQISDALKLKSCYLLAKIPNWRLVTNFVPASKLTNEKFSKIIPLNEDEDDDTEEALPLKNKYEIKYSLIYNDKYEENVDKFLEGNIGIKKNIKSRIFNEESIIAQYHYNTLKIKNKLKQGFFRINYLNIKHENLKNAIEENNKNHSFHFAEFS
jgi:hypothetical protein